MRSDWHLLEASCDFWLISTQLFRHTHVVSLLFSRNHLHGRTFPGPPLPDAQAPDHRVPFVFPICFTYLKDWEQNKEVGGNRSVQDFSPENVLEVSSWSTARGTLLSALASRAACVLSSSTGTASSTQTIDLSTASTLTQGTNGTLVVIFLSFA